MATSIGEEGLDIGDVDLIICYDTSSSPIRMVFSSFLLLITQLQRMGRTGRKRQGRVVFLCTEGKEERDHIRSQDNYEKIQQKIAAGNEFEFDLDNSPRILPREIQPDCIKQEIIPPNETPDDLELKLDRRKKLPKRQKDWTLPENTETGFIRASTLGKRKRQTTTDVEPAFVDPDTLRSPFMSESEEERVRRLRVHVSPTPRRIDILDTKSTGSVPASSVRKRLVRTRKAMRNSKPRETRYEEDDFADLNSTPPNLFATEASKKVGLSERSVNVSRKRSKSPDTKLFSGWDEISSSPDDLPDISMELFFTEKTNVKKALEKDSDEEYGLPSEFEETPRKRIRIATFSDDE